MGDYDVDTYFYANPRDREDFSWKKKDFHLHTQRDVDEIRCFEIRRTHETSKQSTSGIVEARGLLHFPFTFDFILQIFSRLSLLSWPFFGFNFFSFTTYSSSALSASAVKLSQFFAFKARQTLQIHYEYTEEKHNYFFCIVEALFILYEIFFHFHYVFNSHREETRVLSYSYVAGGRVKTFL